MNADLQGMLSYFKHKKMNNIITTEKGYKLSDKEAREYIKYCMSSGHTELKTCPEFEDVREKLKL